MEDQELVNHVRLALNPEIQNLVLFSNGTVVVFGNPNSQAKRKVLVVVGELIDWNATLIIRMEIN